MAKVSLCSPKCVTSTELSHVSHIAALYRSSDSEERSLSTPKGNGSLIESKISSGSAVRSLLRSRWYANESSKPKNRAFACRLLEVRERESSRLTDGLSAASDGALLTAWACV